MTQDYFAELKKQPYPLFTAPKPYSFDLNEDIVKMLKADFSADKIVAALVDSVKGANKAGAEAFFKDMGVKMMRKTIQLSDEYPDRTIEMVMETVDRNGKQFMVFPHQHQRYVEVTYLAMQDFLKVPITLNNMDMLSYRIPRCSVYGKIKEKVGEDFAKQMTCKNLCLSALATVQKHIPSVEVLISQPYETAKDTFCEFSLRKL